ncbi:hypothetical protein SpCBS45565_g06525 [Spizellomyces sp. 'palustris']|nr:hypothetical protein SpCBS45565_g06525 [Spizellomyces sp. 'palustris']
MFFNADNVVEMMETDASDDDREYEEEEESDFEEMEYDDVMDFDGLEGEYDDELQLDSSEAVQFILSGGLPRQGESSHVNPRKAPYLHKDNRSEDATQTPAGASSAAERRKNSVYRILTSRETGLMNTQTTIPIAKRFIPNQTKAVIDKYGARAYSGQFSEDGKFFFSCTQDFHVHLYDTSDLSDIRRQRTINAEVGRWTITDCALSPDNRHMIYSSITPIVHLTRAQLDRDDPEQIPLDFDQHFDSNFGIWSIRFSGDGREIVAGTSNNLIVVYDIETRSILHQIPGHTDDVNAVCYAEPMSSHVLFSASDDSFVKVWDRRSLGRNAQPAGVLAGHAEGITYVSSKGDNRYALTNGKDQHMKMWDVRKMLEPNQVRKDPTLRTGYYSEDWDYRIMRYPGSVEFRHPKDCSVQTFTGHSVLKTLIRCHFSPPASTGQRFVYTGSEDGIIRIFALDGTLVQALDPAEALKAASFDDAELANHAIFELLRPRTIQIAGVTRDVTWHPDLPCIISTSWCGAGGAFGATVKHEYVELLNP